MKNRIEMKNQPEKIFLNIGSDNMCFDHDTDNDFNDLIEVTWSEDKIHESDLCYVMEPKWIKINSEADLPKEYGQYIGRLSNNWVVPVTYYAHLKRFRTGGDTRSNPVTHWMSLPQPPKED